MKKREYVVQLRYIDSDGDICSWESVVQGPSRATEIQLVAGMKLILADYEDMDPEDIHIVPGSMFYSYLDSK